ncbi:MAG: transposase [Thermodesulfobacterium sp.]|nr:transposase [Thermodesulfobacterium sp.]MBO8143855.1 transposase [Thermodesulfobacterium sp.]
MYLSVRRDTVEKEVVLFVLGIDEQGYREILDFEVNPGEGAESWGELIKRLYERGINEVLLFVADGIPGLEQKIKEYFPKADFQCCVLHKVRNTLNKVRVKDRKKLAKDLKKGG